MLLKIEAPDFVAGIVSEYRQGDGDMVVSVAPIIDYMKDWSLVEIAAYCRKKKWKLLVISE